MLAAGSERILPVAKRIACKFSEKRLVWQKVCHDDVGEFYIEINMYNN
jgi:hypothetical protein